MTVIETDSGEERSVTFLSEDQVRDLVALAEEARQELSLFSGREVDFNVGAVQLLDEWVEDYLQTRPDPSVQVRLLWTSLLGEMFRRHHNGWWVLRGGKLVIVCPSEAGDWRLVAVREQIDRRIEHGMSESLTYFYNVTRIELKLG